MHFSSALHQARCNLIHFANHLNEEMDISSADPKDVYSYDRPLQEIVQQSMDMLNQYHAAKEQSVKAKVEAYQPLLNHLEALADQVNRSKTIWQRFLSFFIYLSQGEADLHGHIHRVKELAQQAEATEREIWKGDIWYSRQHLKPGELRYVQMPDYLSQWMKWLDPEDFDQKYCDIFSALEISDKEALRSDAGILRESYFRVIGQHKMSSPILEGSTLTRSLKSIRKDIKQFKATFQDQLTAAQLAQLDQVYQNLKNGQKLAFEMYADRQLSKGADAIDKDHHTQRLADVAYSIQKEMILLEKENRMIIPGSCMYEEGGHAVIFEIKHEENGTYTFTIVNTGDGVGTFDGIFYNLWHGWVTKKFCDYTVKDLSLEQVSNFKFLTELVKVLTEDVESIQESFQPIVEHLLDDHPEHFEHGRQHRIQTNGTCSHDSTISWIESSIDPLLFETLNLFMTAEGLKNVETVCMEKVAAQVKDIADGDLLKAEVEGEEAVKGNKIIEKLIEFGKGVFKQRKDQLDQHIEQHQKDVDKNLQDAKNQRQLALSQITKLQKKRDPEHFAAYQQVLSLKMENCKEAYCKVSNQVGLDKPQAPGILDLFNSDKKNAWAAYEKKRNKWDHLVKPDFAQVHQQISKQESLLQEINDDIEVYEQEVKAHHGYKAILSAI